MGITIPLWFLAGDRHAVTVQIFAGKCLQEKGLAPFLGKAAGLIPALPGHTLTSCQSLSLLNATGSYPAEGPDPEQCGAWM